jgi:hypothetical protein
LTAEMTADTVNTETQEKQCRDTGRKEDRMEKAQYQKELQEAVRAADEALWRLRNVQESLESAGRWGIVDMLGGGLFTTMLKHSRIHDAEEEMRAAREALRAFSRELRDVDQEVTLVNIGDFLHFADYFFDGLLADWLVQEKLNEAKWQVASAISRVQEIRGQLMDQLED